MSTELKYRLSLTPSTLRNYAFLLPVSLLLVFTPTLSDAFWTRLSAVTWFALLVIIATFLWCYQKRQTQPLPVTVLVSSTGRWEVIENSHAASIPIEPDNQPRQLSRRSKVTAWALYLDFTHPGGDRSYHWVLVNECCSQDYRRLVRIIRNLPQPR